MYYDDIPYTKKHITLFAIMMFLILLGWAIAWTQ